VEEQCGKFGSGFIRNSYLLCITVVFPDLLLMM